MAYVALSRVRNTKDLRLIAFEPRKIFLSEFYRKLLDWMDENDVFNESPDKSVPFPEWSARDGKFAQHMPNSQINYDESELDVEPVPSPKRPPKLIRAGTESVLPSKKSQKTSEDEPMDTEVIQDEPMPSQPVISIDDLPAKCEQLLRQLLTKRIYTEDMDQLVIFRRENSEIVDRVLNVLSEREPMIVNQITVRPRRFINDVIPEVMQNSYRIYDIIGDGNCFYSAISLALFGSPKFMSVMRFATVMAMVDYRYYFQTFAERSAERPDTDPGILRELIAAGTPTQHISAAAKIYPHPERYTHWFDRKGNQISSRFTWAHEIHQVALVAAMKRPVHIYTDYTGDGAVRATIVAGSASDDHRRRKPVCVQLKASHFESVIPMSLNAVPEECAGEGTFRMMNADGELKWVYPLDFGS